jgi:predicted phosphate transport protein (TIGR00153 family)
LESIRVRLIPRDEQFYDLFADLAKRLVQSARLLTQLFSEPARLEHYVGAIKAVEHEADNITAQVNLRIDRSFVTPIDREDIHELASKLDNVIDLIDGTARRAVMFRVTDTREHAKRLSRVLAQAAAELHALVTGMKQTKVVTARSAEVKRLEEEGDSLYHEWLGRLFEGSPDALTVIKWKEIYDNLEKTLDYIEDASNVLESISIKHG